MSKDKAVGQESEQSMEDILASIRKIISDDDEPEDRSGSSSYADDDEDVSGAYSAGEDDDDDDVLELSDPLPDDEPQSAAASSAEPAAEDGEADAGDLLIVEDMEEEAMSEASAVPANTAVEAEPEPEADTNSDDDDDEFGLVFEDAPEEAEDESIQEADEPGTVVAPQPAEMLQSGLLSPEAAALSAGALAALRNGDPVTGAMGIGSNGNTVEALVADLLKPMLKQWLDIYLPSMVENLVREEIQRIQRQDKD